MTEKLKTLLLPSGTTDEDTTDEAEITYQEQTASEFFGDLRLKKSKSGHAFFDSTNRTKPGPYRYAVEFHQDDSMLNPRKWVFNNHEMDVPALWYYATNGCPDYQVDLWAFKPIFPA